MGHILILYFRTNKSWLANGYRTFEFFSEEGAVSYFTVKEKEGIGTS